MSPRRDSKMRVIQHLTAGHESALLLRHSLVDSKSHVIPKLLESIILSFENSITALNSRDVQSQAPSSSVRKGRRGCYKRRKGAESWTQVVPELVDDGQTWRKYGQKSILNATFPRSYFRCTHKKDRGCPATKQVQQIQSNPPMYTLTYDCHHTCTTLPTPSGPHHSSSILLNFNSPQSTNIHPASTLIESSDYMLSPQFAGFEDIGSNASSNCTYLDQGMEFLQHDDFEDVLKWEFDF